MALFFFHSVYPVLYQTSKSPWTILSIPNLPICIDDDKKAYLGTTTGKCQRLLAYTDYVKLPSDRYLEKQIQQLKEWRAL